MYKLKKINGGLKLKKETEFFNLALITLTILSMVFFTAACNDAAEERADQVGGVTARQIMENPSAYVGKVVTVSGEVDDIFEARAFKMDSGLTTGELLVIGRDAYPSIPEASNRAYVVGDVATVTGKVAMMVTADIEREIGWDLSPQIEAEYSGKPVLIAQKVLFKPGPRSVTVPVAPGGDANMNGMTNINGTTSMNANMTDTGMNANNANMAGGGTGGEVTDLAVVINAPDRNTLIGRRLNISRVQVQSVPGNRVFIVGPDENKGLPVVLLEEATPQTKTEGLVDINPGQTISLRGEIIRMPSQDTIKQRFNGMLTEQEVNNLAKHQVYLRSDSNSINILQRP